MNTTHKVSQAPSFEMKELEDTASLVESGKAPGSDGIKISREPTQATTRYNESTTFKPICLLDGLGKVYKGYQRVELNGS